MREISCLNFQGSLLLRILFWNVSLNMTNVNKENLSFKLTIYYKKFLINPNTVVEALHIPRVPNIGHPSPNESIFDTNELNSRPCGHTT